MNLVRLKLISRLQYSIRSVKILSSLETQVGQLLSSPVQPCTHDMYPEAVPVTRLGAGPAPAGSGTRRVSGNLQVLD